MSMEQQFRSVMFGGFHKGDVLAYIEASARAHAQEVEALREELRQLRQAEEEARSRAESAESQVGELSPRAAQMEKTTGELEEKRSGLAAAERELRELRDKISTLEPKALAYEAVKEKVAGMEMEAHQRAGQITADAEAAARQSREETEKWLGQVRSSYERLRTDLEATLSHAAGEMERVVSVINEVNQEFKLHDEGIQKLTGQRRP